MTTHLINRDEMKQQVADQLDNARQLEKLYREHPKTFSDVVDEMYREQPGHKTLEWWSERLHFTADTGRTMAKTDWVFLCTAIILSGFIAKMPDFFGIDQEFFYSRNISFIVFPFLAVYFFIRQKAGSRLMVFTALWFVAACIYMNLLPNDPNSDPLILANLHMPFFIWSLVGLAFTGKGWTNTDKRLSFLQFNGDLAVMGAILGIAGGMMMAITFALFQLIGVNLEDFYATYLAFWLLPALPLTATLLVVTQNGLVSRISPVVARIFSPLVLVMLFVYLVSMSFGGIDPFNNRDFLIMFNVLLVGVMALIVFSVVSHREDTSPVYARFILPVLCLVTLIVNGIALSAIIFRITEWGITPNRLAVLGSNLLIMIHLLLVTYHFFKDIRQPGELAGVRHTLAVFLPVYTGWAVFVAVAFPWMF